MTAPSYTTDLNDIDLAVSNANWDESSNIAWDDGGGNDTESDYYIQGSSCVSEALKTGVGTLIADNGSGVTWGTDDVFTSWHYCIGQAAIDLYSNGGFRKLIGSSRGDFYSWDVLGRDYYELGGWVCIPLDPVGETADDTVGSPAVWSSMTKRYFGHALNLSGSIAKGNTHGADALRYGRMESIFEHGDLSNGYCTFDGFATQNDASANKWGQIQEIVSGLYQWQGLISLGNATNAVDFRDENVTIRVLNPLRVYSTFNKIEINNSGSRVDMTNISFVAESGAKSLPSWEVVDDCDINLQGCSFLNWNTFIFDSLSDVFNCIFNGCAQITTGGADFAGSKVLDSTVAADTGALYCDTAYTDTDFDGMVFEMGSNNHHAIDFGTAVTSNLTLRNCEFNGFGSTDDANDSTVRFLATSGSLTLSLVDCTVDGAAATSSNFSIDDAAGITVTLSINPVTVKATVKKSDGTVLQNARVIVMASDALGPFPYDETVTIVNSGTTATVTHNSHGMATNDKVRILGASHLQNNGTFSITYINANSYSYTMASAPGSSPTGTIKATFVALSGLTDVNGEVSTSRVYSANQNVSGWARLSTTEGSLYKTGPISDTVDSSDGMNTTAILISDE